MFEPKQIVKMTLTDDFILIETKFDFLSLDYHFERVLKTFYLFFFAVSVFLFLLSCFCCGANGFESLVSVPTQGGTL